MKKNLLLTLILLPFLCLSQVSLVKDINPGFLDGVATYDNNRISLSGKLLFAGSDGSGAMQLWESDGTNSGTQLISNINNPQNFFYSTISNKIFFSGFTSSTGNEPYATDGTQIGTSILNDINPGNSSSNPKGFIDWPTGLFNLPRTYFASTESTTAGSELWFSDGLSTSVTPLDLYTNGSSEPSWMTLLNGSLYLSAGGFNNLPQKELRILPGGTTGGVLTIEINPSNDGSNPAYLTVFNNKIYFSADDGTNGRELWVTDGTVAGTQMVQDLFPNGSSNPTGLIVYNNFLIFTANNPSTGIEVFKMTTSENITTLKNINPGTGNSSPFGYTVFNGEVYFAADDGNGVELWKSGGFPSNTNKLADINPTGESTPQGFVEYMGELFFNADDGVNGRELWKTDGTTSGTVLVNNIETGPLSSDPLDLIVAGNDLFFSATTAATGRELFKYRNPSLSVNNVEFDNPLVIHPNPTKDYFSIYSNSQLKTVSITDLQGKTIKTFVTAQEKYSISELKSGLYFVTIESKEGVITKKILKK